MCLWLCTTSVHNTAQNSSDNLSSYLQTTTIAWMLSIAGKTGLHKAKSRVAQHWSLHGTYDINSDYQKYFLANQHKWGLPVKMVNSKPWTIQSTPGLKCAVRGGGTVYWGLGSLSVAVCPALALWRYETGNILSDKWDKFEIWVSHPKSILPSRCDIWPHVL